MTKRLSFLIGLILLFNMSHSQLSSKRAFKVSEAVKALQNSKFKDAEYIARKILKQDKYNSKANLVTGICLFKRAMHDWITDIWSIAASFRRGINRRYFRWSLSRTEKSLAIVEIFLSLAESF